MDMRGTIAGAALTLAIALGLFWGLWFAGSVAFEGGGEVPPAEGRGVPTTVMTRTG
jgi:hypothetical protein